MHNWARSYRSTNKIIIRIRRIYYAVFLITYLSGVVDIYSESYSFVSAGSLCYECSSKVADCWCNDCKCDMCEECYTKLHQGRKLSQHQQMPIEQKPESCEDHLCKKRKNDTSVLINNSVNDINKDVSIESELLGHYKTLSY